MCHTRLVDESSVLVEAAIRGASTCSLRHGVAGGSVLLKVVGQRGKKTVARSMSVVEGITALGLFR